MCSNCGKICDQSLMLSCDHNLCMNCAAENIVKNESQGINKNQYVICDLCQKKTEIDTNTSKEVLSFGLINSDQNINDISFNSFEQNNPRFNTTNNIINSTNINNNKNKGISLPLSSPKNVVYFNTNINQANNPKINNIFSKYDLIDITSDNNINTYNSKTICKEHKEPIAYLCLDCLSKCICTECVVHGMHRNHEVLNIKKAYPLIYSKTQEISSNINSKIYELNYTQKNIEQKRKEIYDINNRWKLDIKQAFDDIRNLLNKKEKEIIEKTENNLNDNLNELNTYNQIIKSKIILLNKLNETINVHLMRKDELNLINFYTKNKNKIKAQTELNEIENINNLNINSYSNLKIENDKISFNEMISAINTLNFKVNTLKGLNIRNRHSLGKFTAKRNLYGS